MADYFQNGPITTLHQIGTRCLRTLESELQEHAKRRNMVLLLPALFSEFETEAMEVILKELQGVTYLYKIILGLDRADPHQFHEVKNRMSVLDVPVDVIWNDGPGIRGLYQELEQKGFSGFDIPGKGRNVWTMMAYAFTDKNIYAMGLHDCDIVNYRREIPARLLFPVVHPALDFEFNKGFYARVTDRLHGRATRLFYTPLIRSMERVFCRAAYLDYMDSFRYALSGEVAFIRTLARGIRISPTWGLEVSTLSEVFNHTSENRICQTEIMESYDHKHQDLGEKDARAGVAKMASEIAQAIFREMSQQGSVFSDAGFNSLVATYFGEAHQAINKFNALAKINDLSYDWKAEIAAVDVFVHSLREAIQAFVQDPLGVPSLPAWISVRSVIPDFSDRMQQTVEADNQRGARFLS